MSRRSTFPSHRSVTSELLRSHDTVKSHIRVVRVICVNCSEIAQEGMSGHWQLHNNSHTSHTGPQRLKWNSSLVSKTTTEQRVHAVTFDILLTLKLSLSLLSNYILSPLPFMFMPFIQYPSPHSPYTCTFANTSLSFSDNCTCCVCKIRLSKMYFNHVWCTYGFKLTKSVWNRWTAWFKHILKVSLCLSCSENTVGSHISAVFISILVLPNCSAFLWTPSVWWIKGSLLSFWPLVMLWSCFSMTWSPFCLSCACA